MRRWHGAATGSPSPASYLLRCGCQLHGHAITHAAQSRPPAIQAHDPQEPLRALRPEEPIWRS
jgi:hypothetical protein